MNQDADGPFLLTAVATPDRGTVEVRTSYATYGDCPWHELDDDGRAAWSAFLADMHAAEVELATLPEDQRILAEQLFAGQEREVAELPETLRDCIRTVKEEAGPNYRFEG
jgi:hypothetical protein